MRAVAVALTLLTALALPAEAQRSDGPPRGELEAELRRGFARAVRQRVGLNEDQMRRLAPITQKYANERARIQLDEPIPNASRCARRSSRRGARMTNWL